MKHALLAGLMLATPVLAQDRDGNDTPGEWIVTHQQAYGLWDSVCDTRQTGDLTEDRCYIRYVEVYSPRPNFGALFLFVTNDQIEFGMERGIRFDDHGPRIESAGSVVWSDDRRSCRRGGACTLQPDEAAAFIDIAGKADALRFTFTDRQDVPRDLSWDLPAFAEAVTDWRAQSAARDLPHL